MGAAPYTAALLTALLGATGEGRLTLRDSYSELTRPQLLEQRRLLRETEPSVAGPIVTTVLSPIPIIVGSVFLAIGLSSFLQREPGFTIAGSCILIVGLAELVGGFFWLFRTADDRRAVEARIEEIEALLDFSGPFVPPPMLE